MGGASTELTRARKQRMERFRAFRDDHCARGCACSYCGIVPSTHGANVDFPSVDHALPTTRGGTDEDSNLTYCCRGCNSTKGNRTVAEAYLHLRLRRLRWPRFSEDQIAWMRSRGLNLSELDAMKLHFEDRAKPD